MAYTSFFEGVLFIEGNYPYISNKGTIEYKKTFYNQQFKNLNDVKHQLAEKARALGANAVINFKYGQKNTTWFKAALLGLDDNVNWFGSGEAVVISESSYEQLLEKINNY